MHRAFKYRLYPTKAQILTLDQLLDSAKDLYNVALQQRRDIWTSHRKSINYYDQASELKEIRTDPCFEYFKAWTKPSGFCFQHRESPYSE